METPTPLECPHHPKYEGQHEPKYLRLMGQRCPHCLAIWKSIQPYQKELPDGHYWHQHGLDAWSVLRIGTDPLTGTRHVRHLFYTCKLLDAGFGPSDCFVPIPEPGPDTLVITVAELPVK